MNKKIILLTGVLTAGAAAVLVLEKTKEKAPDPRLGKAIVEPKDVTAVDTIEISKEPSSVKLVLGSDKLWRLGDQNGFPADAAKITRLLDDLTRSHAQVLSSSAKESMNDFGFDAATKVSLKGSDKELLALNIGSSREKGGQYVSFGGEYKVYLINQNLSVLPDAGSWETKTLVNIKADQVKKVEFAPAPSSGKKPVVLVREKAEDPVKPMTVPAGSTEAGSIRSHESILSSVSFSSRVDPSNEEYKSAMAAPGVVTVTLFDGRVYTGRIGSVGKETKKYFLNLTGVKGEATAESDAKDLALLNDLMGRYAFEVPAWVGGKFEKGHEDMFDKKGS